MPESEKDLYAASCNPSRRAKRASFSTVVDIPSAPSPPSILSAQPRAILPMRPYAPRPNTTATDTTVAVPPPAKRGRKPGPLSRTAREAQRRLNHSIIEKARRTKINDALATLKQLVPANYGQPKPRAEESRDDVDDDFDEDDDEDYEAGAKKPKPKPKGKKEEKEKEFKLEILIRTVSFLQDLLKRVAVLEAAPPTICQNCSAGNDPKKRKRAQLEDDDGEIVIDDDQAPRSPKILRTAKKPPSSSGNPQSSAIAPIPIAFSRSHTPLPNIPPIQPHADARLPPISSWLPDSAIDPQLLPSQDKSYSSLNASSYLPSPPSSTHFDPVRSSQFPPVLNLGPVATAAMVNPNSRTPEDESAASLLLQIATSPSFRPVSSSSAYALPDPSNFSLHSDMRSQRDGHVRQAQTPASILGLSSDRLKRKY